MQNGKHAIARNLINGFGFGTTEFHVIRPLDDTVAEWVHSFLCLPSVLNEAVNNFTGTAGQRRVPPEFLANLPIPLPPIDEQRRIVARLNEQMAAAERAQRAAERVVEAAAAIPAALLRDTFEAAVR